VSRTVSNVILAVIVLAIVAGGIGAMFSVVSPHGTLGLTVAWHSTPRGRQLLVSRVAPRSPAEAAGIVRGDRIAGFPSLNDRIAVALESNLESNLAEANFFARGQTVTFDVARSTGVRRVSLRAAATAPVRLLPAVELRLIIYLLGVLIVAGLVALRPNVITWSFALFVIFGQQPNVLYVQFAGMFGSPLFFAIVLYGLVPCTGIAGLLGLVAFAARFPEHVPHPGYRSIERLVQLFMLVMLIAYAQYYLGELFGMPDLPRGWLNDGFFFVPTLVAVALLAGTLQRSRGDDRTRLLWALLGPALGILLSFADVLTVASKAPYGVAAVFGILASVAPFSMMYAILRHRVIDVGFALDRALAKAISLPQSPSSGKELDRRDFVRRIALLLSTELPLKEIVPQIAALLRLFVAFDAIDVSLTDRNETCASPAEENGRPFQSAVEVPIAFGGSTVGSIAVRFHDRTECGEGARELLELCALYLGAVLYPPHSVDRAQFDEALAQQWYRCTRSHAPISVLLLDVDCFARFNELYGYVAGDACLQQIAGTMASFVKDPGGCVARYAAETFAALLPACDAVQAVALAERIRDAVRGLSIVHQGSSLGVITASIGIASCIPEARDVPNALLAGASGQLRRAKERGRNRVVSEHYGSHTPPATQVVVPGNLPAPTAFVGRKAELAEIERLLQSHAFVAVTAPAGYGKTATLLEVARRSVSRYQDGVWFVDLSSVLSGDAIARTVAATVFGPLRAETNPMQLAALLRDKQLLLLLDGVTHHSFDCAKLAGEILETASGVRILVASERPLPAPSDGTYPLPELALDERVQLFLERARNGHSSDDARAIVERVEATPLAVELAAASCHGELHEASPTASLALQRLSVFADGFTEAAAHAVVDPNALRALVGAALVRCRGDGRLSIPDALRERGLVELKRDGKAVGAMREHLRYYAGRAREMTERKANMPFDRWMTEQRAEFANYRIALRRAFRELDDPASAGTILRSLFGALAEFAVSYDFFSELRKLLRAADVPAATQAACWVAVAELRAESVPADCLRAARRALDLFPHAGDDVGAAYATWLLAGAHVRERGYLEVSLQPALLDAVATARQAGDRHLAIGLLRNLALLESDDTRHEDAERTLAEAAELSDPSDTEMLAMLLGDGALLAFRTGSVDRAIATWRQAASMAEERAPLYAALCFAHASLGELTRGDAMAARVALRKALPPLVTGGHRFGIALCFDRFAELAKSEGALESAARCAGFAQASYDRGAARALFGQKFVYQLLDELRRQLGNAGFESAWSRGQWMNLNDAVAEAMTM
jgi:diguanylate cyclase (GGDEF)-like protein